MKRYANTTPALGLALATSLAAMLSVSSVLAQSQATPPAAQPEHQQQQQRSTPSTDSGGMRMQGTEHGRQMQQQGTDHGRQMQQQGTEHGRGMQGMGPRMMDRQPERK